LPTTILSPAKQLILPKASEIALPDLNQPHTNIGDTHTQPPISISEKPIMPPTKISKQIAQNINFKPQIQGEVKEIDLKEESKNKSQPIKEEVKVLSKEGIKPLNPPQKEKV